jgi:hypothetical protein
MTNSQLQKLFAEKEINDDDYHVVRLVYILENQKDEILLTLADGETYPHILFGDKWQFLNDTYDGCDLFTVDEIKTVCECVHQYTNIRIIPEQVQLIDFELIDTTLHWAVYTKLLPQNREAAFQFWGEYCSESAWVAKSEVLDKLEVEIDREFWQQINAIVKGSKS